MHYFRIFFKKFKQPFVNFFERLEKNTVYWKVWDSFRKASKIFLINCKRFLILAYFSNEFKKAFITFSRVWTRNTIYWKFFENFPKISKNFLGKLQKTLILA